MQSLTSNDVYNSVHDLIYNHTESFVWSVFVFLVLAFFVVTSAKLLRFLVTLIVFAAVVAAGLYFLGYVHTNP